MGDAEQYVARWLAAGLLGEPQAEAIRRFEAAQAQPRGRQWQVLLALILGGILLGAGVLLFVAAHWDTVSPPARLGLVLLMLVFFHGLGLLVRERFAGFATAMHALGTVAAGAAIALVGQIFNMEEHWPAAVLLWAACAAAGWLLLRDQFQQTLTLLLVPAWVLAEYSYRVEGYRYASVFLARLGLVFGCALLTAFLHSRRRAVFGILFGCGGLLVAVCVGVLAEGWQYWGYARDWGPLPLPWRLLALALAALTAAAAWGSERWSLAPVVMAAALAWALPWAQTTITEHNGEFAPRGYTHTEPSLLAYALVALAAVLLVAWGVRTTSKALVNYGIAAFALTVFWFYFSSVMDKLGRSLGLIALGLLFLGGGYALELTRRRLVRGMEAGAA